MCQFDRYRPTRTRKDVDPARSASHQNCGLRSGVGSLLTAHVLPFRCFKNVTGYGLSAKKLVFYFVCGFFEGHFHALLLLFFDTNSSLHEVSGSRRFKIPEIDNGRLIREMCLYSRHANSKFARCRWSKNLPRPGMTCVGEIGSHFTAQLGPAHVNPSQGSSNLSINGRHLRRPFKHPKILPSGRVRPELSRHQFSNIRNMRYLEVSAPLEIFLF